MALPVRLRTAKKLSEVRVALTKVHPDAARILSKVWDYNLDQEDGIPVNQLYHLENPEVPELVAELSPFFLVKDDRPHRDRYYVTLLGALVAQGGQDDAKLMVRFLELMKSRYAKGEIERPILNPEVCDTLKVGGIKAYRAAALIHLGGFCQRDPESVSKNFGFAIKMPSNMHQLQHEENLWGIVEAKALEVLNEVPEVIPDGVRETPPLTHSQHAEVWDIPLANISKDTSPLGRLWRKYRRPDKTAAFPLGELSVLLRNYWSRHPKVKHEPMTEDGVYDLYVKKGYAEERDQQSK